MCMADILGFETRAKAAEIYNVPIKTLYAAVDRGDLRSRKLPGGTILVRLEDVEEWDADRQHAAGRPKKQRPDGFDTRSNAAAIYGVPIKTLQAAIDRGDLCVVESDGSLLLELAAVERWNKKRRKTGGRPKKKRAKV